MFERYRVIHFVGIGGIGMSGIAELLHNLGYEVTGSDLKDSETTRRLRDLGIKVSVGHGAENIDNAHVVVISSAVSDDNPEVIEAKRKSLPVIPRAEMLAELARLKYGILVAGAHGKTTTTSLISTILAHCGFDPTVVIGGRLKATGSNARLGQGEFLVAEADESDGSFLKLSPTIAVVTNIDREHMNFFKTIESLKDAFLSFMNKIPFYGVSIVCIENEHLRELLPSIHRRYITYGFTHDAELRAINIMKGFMSMSFDAIYRGRTIGEFYLPLAGTHNVLNSLAAIGAALELRIDILKIKEGLKSFEGIQRRFEFRGEANGIKIFDDYGHHPTEIKATLKAAREGLFISGQKPDTGTGRLFVLFQPHRYTRTKDLMDEFSTSFDDADSLILLNVYSAGEKPFRGADSETLLKRIKKAGHKNAVYIKDKEDALKHIITTMRRGDILLTLGAGNVWKIGEEILNKLKMKNEK
ncbi:MAG: UDP-N-acetylmuramate--L-alanine ligase [Nitrospirota bacterium]|nr:UDP-N-acetylmuramate--L-alanine ligase [Nitrospirota bacterium]MDH5768098.1 UDP-N-acetylmuramate--L-alanine ligase [Nitrospirota bacterium]